MTIRKMMSMNEGEKRIGEEKQQVVTELEIDLVVQPQSENEEEMKAEDDQQKKKIGFHCIRYFQSNVRP